MPTIEQIFPETEYAESVGVCSEFEPAPLIQEGQTGVLQIDFQLIPESFAIGMQELEDGLATDF